MNQSCSGGMADLYGGRKPLFEDEDLQEEEVWSLVRAREDSNSKIRKNDFSGSSSSNSNACRSAAPRAIRRADGSGSSTAWTEPQQSSASVDIPDLSKISKRMSNKNLWDDASGAHENGDDNDYMGWKNRHGLVDAESYDDEDGIEKVPPHEYLARRLASTQVASFSMCEGVGRTLKGRDLSKLRNAILTKTGFLE